MTPNEKARKNIEALISQLPSAKRRGVAVTPGGKWPGWKMSLGRGQFTTAVQPQPSGGFGSQLFDFVREAGFAVADAYVAGEIAEQERDAYEAQMRAEIQRAQLANERAAIEAEAARNALAAEQYQRELLESQQAELNLDRVFSNSLFPVGIAVVLGLGVWALAR